MAAESPVQEASSIEANDIGLDFVPVRSADVLQKELDDELVLMNMRDGTVHVLNPTGSVVWACFDGSGSLSSIVDDIADAFSEPRDKIEEDVLGITRWIGEAGLLEGVVRTERPDTTPEGLEPGVEMTPFALPALEGPPIDLRDLRSSQVLLVNWSPYCSFCERVAPELALAQPALEAQGVRLVLLSTGDEKENRDLLESSGLRADVLLPPEEPAAGYEDPFPGMGTPVAYLLDTDGRVAAPLAYGANEVPRLAGRAAELLPITAAADGATDEVRAESAESVWTDEEGGPRYLPAASGVCGPGTVTKNPRTWAGTSAYAVGEYHVGIRADSQATDDLLGRLFASFRLPEGTRAPDNFSVILESASEGTRGLNLLLEADTTVVRSRSARRVLAALAARLSSLASPEDGLMRTTDVAALIDGEAVLLPDVTLSWLEQVQPRLARVGVRLSDEPFAAIDVERLELVVPEPVIPLDLGALDALPAPGASRSELPPIEPGRYRLRAWAIDFPEEKIELTRPQAISAVWGGLVGDIDHTPELVDRLAGLFTKVDVIPLAFDEPEEFVDEIRRLVVPAA